VISALGSVGTAKDYGTARQLDLTVASSVPAGAVVVVWFSSHSLFNVAFPTNSWNFWGCRDDAGNTYSNIAAVTQQGAFQRAGPLTHIYVSQLENGLAPGDKITMWTDPTLFAGSNWAKAMSVEAFDFDGDRIATCFDQDDAGFAATGDPAVIGLGALPGTEALWLYSLAIEAPDTESVSIDADYTDITPIGFNSGTLVEDISLWGAYRIDSLPLGDTVNATDSTSSTRRYAECMAALCAVPTIDVPFPETGIYDDFNRADEYPIDGGGRWSTALNDWAFGSDWIAVIGNKAGRAGGSKTTLEMLIGQCGEVYATYDTLGTGDPSAAGIHMVATGNSAGPNFDGVGAYWTVRGPGSTRTGTPLGRIDFGESGNGGRVGGRIWCYSWAPVSAGAKWGIRRTKGVKGAFKIDRLYVDYGGGWEEIIAGFARGGWRQSGKFALSHEEGVSRTEDFGAGAVPCGSTFRPQIYRRVLGVA
jgi:hypothetical protein